MTVDENQHALTGAYALDALDPAEKAGFEAHLTTCPECRRELTGLRETAARLALAAWVTPPTGLRERVLVEVGATSQVALTVAGEPTFPDVRAVAGERSDVPAASDAPPTDRRPARASGPTGRPPAWRRWWVAAAATVVLVAGGLTGGALAAHQHRVELAAAAQAHMMVIATAPDAVSHGVAFGTSHVVMSEQMSAAALVGEDVPMPARAGMTYQLWMVHADGSTAPGPTFVPQGGRVLTFVEADLSAVTALRVTEEPMGGSTAPSGRVVASVDL